jgi:hypothetical protein
VCPTNKIQAGFKSGAWQGHILDLQLVHKKDFSINKVSGCVDRINVLHEIQIPYSEK